MRIRTSPAGRGAEARPGEQGFTLLELLIILLIIGLTAAAIPGFVLGSGSSTALDHATQSMASGLRDVRHRAIRQNRDDLFVVDVENRYFRPGFGERATRIDGGIALDMKAAKRERLGDSSVGIRFFPDGSSTGGRVVLAIGDQRRAVAVDWLTGSVSVDRHAP